MLAFHLVGRPVAQGGMQIVLIEPLDPAAHLLGHFVLVLPLPQPQQLFLHRPDRPLGVGVALGVAVAGEGLADSQVVTGPHERHRRRLAAVV